MTSYDSWNQSDKNCSSMFRPKIPHFFKIILDDSIQDQKLEIPREFVKKYGDGLSSPVLLKVPSGDTWQVELKKSDGDVWLENGWQEFAQHYFQKYGLFLVFKYEENGNFQVLIFGMSATEIEYPYISGIEDYKRDEECQEPDMKEAKVDTSDEILSEPDKQESDTSDEEMLYELDNKEYEDDTSDDILYEPPSRRKSRKKLRSPCSHPRKRTTPTDKRWVLSPATEGVEGSTARRSVQTEVLSCLQQLTATQRTDAIQKAIAFKSAGNPEHPCFIVVLKEHQKRDVNVPSSFAKELGWVKKQSTTIMDHEGRKWEVSISVSRSSGCSRVRLVGGWPKFLRENGIVVGDALLFEHNPNTGNLIHFKIISKASQSNEKQWGDETTELNLC